MDTLKVNVINIKDFTNSNFFGISIDNLVSVLISALVVVLVFGLGIYFSKKSELRKQFRHLKKIEFYFYAVFDDIKKSVRAKIKSFESLISQLNEEVYKDIEMKYVSDYSMEFINDINWIDLFSVFTTLKIKKDDENIKLYQNINRRIAGIRDINLLWLDSYKDFFSRQSVYDKRWNSSITEIGKQVDNFAHWMRAEHYERGTNTFIDELDNIIGTHQGTENAKDIFVAINTLINPLHTHISNNQEQRIGKAFLDHVMGCKYAYANFIKNREATVSQFKFYIKALKSNIRSLNSDIKKLKQMEDNIPRFIQIWRF